MTGGWKGTSMGRHPDGWHRLRRAVIARAGGVCEVSGCGRRGRDVDHIRPLAEGGLTIEENLQFLCAEHHQAKTLREAQRGQERRRARALRPVQAHPGLIERTD